MSLPANFLTKNLPLSLMQALLPSLPRSAVFVFDADLRLLLARGQALLEAGYDPALLEGHLLAEVVPPASYAHLESYYRAALSGEVRSGELSHSGRYYSVSTSPLHDETGAIVAGLILSQDLTAQKQAEGTAAQNEARHEALVHAIEGIVWAMDSAEMRFTYVSPQAERILGYPLAEWYKPGFWEAHIHPEDREWAVAFCTRAAQLNQSHTFEYRMVAADGRLVWLRDVVTLSVEKGQVVSMQGVMVDVSDRYAADARIRRTLAGTIKALATVVERRDPYTAGHHERSMLLCLQMGRLMGLSPEEQETLWTAALLHDIGNIGVPADILNRPAVYSRAERAVMQTHVQTGYEILRDTALPAAVAELALMHHERLDGSGYPRGLQGDEIPDLARILAVADVFEAIVSHRPYRPAYPIEKGITELTQGRGVLYCPRAVDACLEVLRQWEFDFEAFVAARRTENEDGWQVRVERMLGEEKGSRERETGESLG